MYNIYLLPTPVSKHNLDRYIKFISNISNPKDAITEQHHILPKSMGGSNDRSNLIDLTPRQHYLAHWMLWQSYGWVGLSVVFFVVACFGAFITGYPLCLAYLPEVKYWIKKRLH
jgi:hypothetical protein